MRGVLSGISLQYFLLTVILGASATTAAAQKRDSFSLKQSLRVHASAGATDRFGNVYVLTDKPALEKYNASGKLVGRYTNNRYGVPASFDATNPLKVLLWFPEFRTVVFLDRNLTELGELNLPAAELPEARLVAPARDGNLWVYEEAGFKIVKITPEGAPLQEMQALNLLLPGRPNIQCIRDEGDAVYVNDPGQGTLVFNLYGQLQSQFFIGVTSTFFVSKRALVFLNGPTVQHTELPTLESVYLPLPIAGQPDDARWLTVNGLLVQRGEMLEVYETTAW